MAVSGVTTFNSTAREIVEDALRDLGVIREDEPVSDGETASAIRKLNRMIKTWQSKGVHLWTKKTATIFLQKDQSTYTLNSSSSDHATISYEATSLSTDYALGAAQVVFNDAITATAGDYIGIELDSGILYWDTISNVVNTTTVDLTGTLPSAASEDNVVYVYTTKLDQPFNVFSAARKNATSSIDVPMHNMSYQEYFDLPNKTSSGTPVNYQYDRQRDSSIIRVWPVPDNVDYRMEITIAEKIDDIVVVSNNFDFPQEWQEALELNMAVRLGPGHGVSKTQDFQELKMQAADALNDAMMLDAEQGSVYLQIDEESSDYA
jgi:hypothetical protein